MGAPADRLPWGCGLEAKPKYRFIGAASAMFPVAQNTGPVNPRLKHSSRQNHWVHFSGAAAHAARRQLVYSSNFVSHVVLVALENPSFEAHSAAVGVS